MLRVLAQQHLVAAQPLDDALAVVEPVDADDQQAVAQRAMQGLGLALGLGRGGQALDLPDVDPDRARLRLDDPVAQPQPAALHRLRTQLALGIVEEVVAIDRGLEADHVVGAQILGEAPDARAWS